MCLRYFKIIIVFHPHLLHIFFWVEKSTTEDLSPTLRGGNMQIDAEAQDPGWGDAWNYTCSHPCLWTAPWVRDVWLVRGPSQRGGALCVFEHIFKITMGMEAGFPTAPLRSPDDYNIYIQHLHWVYNIYMFSPSYRKLSVAIFRADIGFIKNCV